ncbi:MAG: hypothetical protein ACT4PT_05525, partial [Methanobacteriota archaeon]
LRAASDALTPVAESDARIEDVVAAARGLPTDGSDPVGAVLPLLSALRGLGRDDDVAGPAYEVDDEHPLASALAPYLARTAPADAQLQLVAADGLPLELQRALAAMFLASAAADADDPAGDLSTLLDAVDSGLPIVRKWALLSELSRGETLVADPLRAARAVTLAADLAAAPPRGASQAFDRWTAQASLAVAATPPAPPALDLAGAILALYEARGIPYDEELPTLLREGATAVPPEIARASARLLSEVVAAEAALAAADAALTDAERDELAEGIALALDLEGRDGVTPDELARLERTVLLAGRVPTADVLGHARAVAHAADGVALAARRYADGRSEEQEARPPTFLSMLLPFRTARAQAVPELPSTNPGTTACLREQVEAGIQDCDDEPGLGNDVFFKDPLNLVMFSGTASTVYDDRYVVPIPNGVGGEIREQVLTVDLGGDDAYFNNAGGTAGLPAQPGVPQRFAVAVAIDAGGADVYRSGGSFRQGAAQNGIGILIDAAGNDRYTAGSRSQGAAAGLGVGILVDGGGADAYEAGDDAQASGFLPRMAGTPALAVLLDLDGSDAYVGGFRSQARAGLFVDLAGADRYDAPGSAQGFERGFLLDLGGADSYQSPEPRGLRVTSVVGNYSLPSYFARRADDSIWADGANATEANLTPGASAPVGVADLGFGLDVETRRSPNAVAGCVVDDPRCPADLVDSDRDGFVDVLETALGSDPRGTGTPLDPILADSDDDAFLDLVEAALQTDPYDPDDHPIGIPAVIGPVGAELPGVGGPSVTVDPRDVEGRDVYGTVERGAGEDLPDGSGFVVKLAPWFVLGDFVRSGHARDALVAIDFGGADNYTNNAAGPIAEAPGLALVLDLSGNDVYYAPTRPCVQGCGGVLIDLAGADRYRALTGQGAATPTDGNASRAGLLLDVAGDDVYRAENESQGFSGNAAPGIFVDLAGDDRYTGVRQGVTMAPETLFAPGADPATAVFIDVRGTDAYALPERRSQGRVLGDGNRTYAFFLDLGGVDSYVLGGAESGDTRNGRIFLDRPRSDSAFDVPAPIGNAHMLSTSPEKVGQAQGVFLDGELEGTAAVETAAGTDPHGPESAILGGGHIVFFPNLGLTVADAGANFHADDAGLLIDLGGADRYENNAAGVGYNPFGRDEGETGLRFNVAVVVDVEGDDLYSAPRPRTIAATEKTIGVLVDAGGNDVYYGGGYASVVASSLCGPALLVDLSGHDAYVAVGNSFAFASGEVECPLVPAPPSQAVLIDVAGRDFYQTRADAADAVGTGRKDGGRASPFIDLGDCDTYRLGPFGTTPPTASPGLVAPVTVLTTTIDPHAVVLAEIGNASGEPSCAFNNQIRLADPVSDERKNFVDLPLAELRRNATRTALDAPVVFRMLPNHTVLDITGPVDRVTHVGAGGAARDDPLVLQGVVDLSLTLLPVTCSVRIVLLEFFVDERYVGNATPEPCAPGLNQTRTTSVHWNSEGDLDDARQAVLTDGLDYKYRALIHVAQQNDPSPETDLVMVESTFDLDPPPKLRLKRMFPDVASAIGPSRMCVEGQDLVRTYSGACVELAMSARRVSPFDAVNHTIGRLTMNLTPILDGIPGGDAFSVVDREIDEIPAGARTVDNGRMVPPFITPVNPLDPSGGFFPALNLTWNGRSSLPTPEAARCAGGEPLAPDVVPDGTYRLAFTVTKESGFGFGVRNSTSPPPGEAPFRLTLDSCPPRALGTIDAEHPLGNASAGNQSFANGRRFSVSFAVQDENGTGPHDEEPLRLFRAGFAKGAPVPADATGFPWQEVPLTAEGTGAARRFAHVDGGNAHGERVYYAAVVADATGNCRIPAALGPLYNATANDTVHLRILNLTLPHCRAFLRDSFYELPFVGVDLATESDLALGSATTSGLKDVKDPLDPRVSLGVFARKSGVIGGQATATKDAGACVAPLAENATLTVSRPNPAFSASLTLVGDGTTACAARSYGGGEALSKLGVTDEGVYDLVIEVRDLAGSRRRSDPIQFTVDESPPIVANATVTYPRPGAARPGDRIELGLHACDEKNATGGDVICGGAASGSGAVSVFLDTSSVSRTREVGATRSRTDATVWRASILLDAPHLSTAEHPIPATVRDAVGNVQRHVAAASISVVKDAANVTDASVEATGHDRLGLRWNTSSPASTAALVGTAAADFTDPARRPNLRAVQGAPGLSREHRLEVPGLLPNTTYHVQPVSVNGAGFESTGAPLPVTTRSAIDDLAVVSPAAGSGLGRSVEVVFTGRNLAANATTYAVGLVRGGVVVAESRVVLAGAGPHRATLSTAGLPEGPGYSLRIAAEASERDLRVLTVDGFSVDTSPPRILRLAPARATASALPELAADFEDRGSAVDPASLRVLLDGAGIEPTVANATRFSAVPRGPLAPGPHQLEVEVRDLFGEVSRARSRFVVDDEAPRIASLETVPSPGRERLRPGGLLVVSARASDATALSLTLDLRPLGGDVVDLLPSLSAGRFRATIPVPVDATPGVHRIVLRAVDEAGNEATRTARVVVDATPPELRFVTTRSEHVRATLVVATDEPVVVEGVLARAGGERIAFSDADLLSRREIRVEGLRPSQDYLAVLTLTDGAGHVTRAVRPVTTTVDLVPPGAVPGLEALDAERGIRLSWRVAPDNAGVSHYRVERAADVAGPYETVVETPERVFVDRDVVPGVPQYYVVVAIDLAGNSGPPGVPAVAVATPAPELFDGGVTPGKGPADRPFVFHVTYRSA